MPIYFHRLENALKRANEFIDVGKKPRALEILCDVLRSRKHRTWQKKHEDIMIKYLELCVELKKSYVAKEGIYQYKIICQQTYINSFEDVVRKYLKMAEEKANLAKEESQASVLDVDDLDYVQTPEDILLRAVSNEDTQDRTDRVVLIPWVKFLWESYRQCLDLLKNNSRTERLYHDIAHEAFKFCIKYNRKTEFRKLCDNLHAHLDILKKQQQQNQQVGHQQQNAINLNNAESQAMHLETRLVQLDCAIQMELWQEAYKATDDIKRFGLMNLSKKPPKPQLMANYYQKLSLVFWKANCPLFHSAALFRLFHLSKELRKNITPEDIQRMASKVVCATLAIPIPPNRPEIDKLVDTEENIIESHQRNLASLLGLTSAVPTRSSLITDLKRMGVLQHAYPPLQELYRCLELDFHPLVLCTRVQQVIDFLEKCSECPDLKQYVNALKDVTIIRLLKEVSQVYQTIEFSRLLELCPFTTKVYLEKMVVEAARRNDLQVRVDHRKGCLIFGTELRVSQGEELIEGPHLQSMPSEQIRRQLVNMYSTLQKARQLIEPERIKEQRELIKRKIMKTYKVTATEEHKRILDRQGIIEEKKEQLEQLGIRREEEERKNVEEQQQRLMEAEKERLSKEAEERERQRKIKQDIELKKQMAIDQISMIKGSLMGNLLENLDDEELAKLRPEDIQTRRIEQLEKERREQLTKQRKVERKFDHLERAKRLEEIPLLEKHFEEWKVNDEQLWDQMEEERIRDIKSERTLALQHKQRFLRIIDDKTAFAERIRTQRHSVYVSELNEFQKVFDEEKRKRLELRRIKRKEDRKKKWVEEKTEAQKKAKMEAERKVNEEKKRQLDLIAERQRQKEREIEEKMMAREKEREREREEKDKASREMNAEKEDEINKERDTKRLFSRAGVDTDWRRKINGDGKKEDIRRDDRDMKRDDRDMKRDERELRRDDRDIRRDDRDIRRDDRDVRRDDRDVRRDDREMRRDFDGRKDDRENRKDDRTVSDWRSPRADDVKKDDREIKREDRVDRRREFGERNYGRNYGEVLDDREIRRDFDGPRREDRDIRRDDRDMRRDDRGMRRDFDGRRDERENRKDDRTVTDWRSKPNDDAKKDDREIRRDDRDIRRDDRFDRRRDMGERKDDRETKERREDRGPPNRRPPPQSSRADDIQDWRSADKKGDDRGDNKGFGRDKGRNQPRKGFDDRKDERREPTEGDKGWTTVRRR